MRGQIDFVLQTKFFCVLRRRLLDVRCGVGGKGVAHVCEGRSKCVSVGFQRITYLAHFMCVCWPPSGMYGNDRGIEHDVYLFALSRIANESSQYTYMRWENLDHIDIYANLSHRVYFQYLCIYAIYSICSICHMMWHSLHANKHKPPQRNFRVDTTNNNLNGKSCFALLRASCRVYYYI